MTGGQTIFKGLLGLDDWIWWIIIGGVAFFLILLVVCFCICMRRARAKGRRDAEEAMQEQRETEARDRMLEEAQIARQQREQAQRLQDEQFQHKLSMSTTSSSAWQQPNPYNASTYGRTSEPGLYRPPSAGPHGFVLHDAEAPYASLQSPNHTTGHGRMPNPRDDSYASTAGRPLNDSTMSADIVDYSVQGTYLSPRSKQKLYSDLDRRQSPHRKSDATDFELDVDHPAERVPSHRSIEF
ncbi:hypothetical protein SPRG_14139 [Saprolegnia parasitica CBS 223.65]|uniref:Uncharacterized protein n=1 Tax=Saprolegnia parasitica (strain CBS 223.65) TaxID=695850 RepID=A0A067BRM3_SAPPC|nr:hypothetical protein SPRG_14139 [Saprolegnia parasitica CBS 223.65]KDO20908.1 hypothetical protein SPRG_14139 [Saprolegnia parasitica CBS 223.65]|eukprot:XP_012208397.1 hypothetical protein SPRG_14139 [Saprolegnia parasitica CBS 223.65]